VVVVVVVVRVPVTFVLQCFESFLTPMSWCFKVAPFAPQLGFYSMDNRSQDAGADDGKYNEVFVPGREHDG
jgi:hypothetical protein